MWLDYSVFKYGKITQQVLFFLTAVSTWTGSRGNGLAWWVEWPTFSHNCQNLGVKCEEKCCLSYLFCLEVLELFFKSLVHSPGLILGPQSGSNRQEVTVRPYLWNGITMQLYFDNFKFWSEIFYTDQQFGRNWPLLSILLQKISIISSWKYKVICWLY